MSTALASRVLRIRRVIAEHKRAIRTHREQLQQAAAELDQLEAEARRLGISLVNVSTGAEGALHGHTAERRRA